MTGLEQKQVDVTPEHDQRSSEEQQYWQIGKSGSESFLELYTRNLWTDVSIRCDDHITEAPDDRLRGHKLVLAARSPVFSAMFFGPNREEETEVQLLGYNKESADAFLRCLYNDCVCPTMDVSAVMDVFRIAHLYQISDIVEKCVDILNEDISVDNACTFLDMAMLYEHTRLKENVLAFIDDNVEAVLKSQSFLTISRGTLQYMLQGDTLYADETHIATAVTQWATTKLTDSGKVVSATTIRELIGRAFFFLRMTSMQVNDYLKTENASRLHTNDENLQILSCLSMGEPAANAVEVHLPHKRGSRVVSIKYSHKTGSGTLSDINSEIIIKTLETISITHLSVALPVAGFKCSDFRNVTHTFDKNRYTLIISCEQAGFQKVRSIVVQQVQGKTQREQLILDPPLVLRGSDVRKYSLNVTANCTAFDNIKYENQKVSAEARDSNTLETGPTITFNRNEVIVGLTFLRQSNRDVNATFKS